MNVKTLVGREIVHKKYGIGIIKNAFITKGLIVVDFKDSVKTFPLDTVNSKFFKFNDEETYELILKAIWEFKGVAAAIEHDRIRHEEEKKERLKNERKVKPSKENALESPRESGEKNIFFQWSHSPKSFDSVAKHPTDVKIKNRQCTIKYAENHNVCETVHKVINDENYSELISVFATYRDLLPTPDFTLFSNQDTCSYKFSFDGIYTLFACNCFFVSDDTELLTRAYTDYNNVMEKIINQ